MTSSFAVGLGNAIVEFYRARVGWERAPDAASENSCTEMSAEFRSLVESGR
jgi:hypothetical protein